MDNLYSVEFEQFILACILQSNDSLLNLSFLKQKDFSKINGILYELFSNQYYNKFSITPLLISEKCKSLGITLEGVEVIDYLEALNGRAVELSKLIEIAKEIKKLALIRHVIKKADELKETVSKATTKPAKEIFEAIDNTIGDSLESFDTNEDDAQNVYEVINNVIEERGNTPRDFSGYLTPFETYNNMFGGLRDGNIYCFAARSGSFKSTLLTNLCDKVANECNKESDIKVLMLDTELTKDDFILRLAAIKTKTPFWLIDTGQWRKDILWYPIMREALKELSNNKTNNLYFKQCGGMSSQDTINFAKKWYYKTVGKGGKALLCYDYMKILAADMNHKSSNEWTAALQKMQDFKNLIDELQCPLLTAVQVNRFGTVNNRNSSEIVDDDSIISTSDRLNWLVSLMCIFRRKSPDEIARDGINFGKLKMIPLKARYLGRDASSYSDLVKIMVDKKVQFKQNYINFDVDNFNIIDKGSFYQCATFNGWTRLAQKENKNEDVAI